MCCKNFREKLVPFVLALLMSIFITEIFQEISYTNNNLLIPPVQDKEVCSIVSNYEVERNPEVLVRSGTNSLKILEKQPPSYTDLARKNSEQGIVKLKVVFLSNGKIGAIKLIKGLNYGLTEQAIVKALNIKFQPATVDGKPITVTKKVEYSFTIY